MSTPTPPAYAARQRISARVVIALVLIVLSLVALAFSARGSIESRRVAEAQKAADARQSVYIECQARVNDQLVRALKARSDSAQARNDATDALIDAILLAKSREEVAHIFATWKASKDKAADDRTSNPLPEPPSDTCGPKPK